MIDIKIGTMEERIIKLLQKEYPITMKEIARKIGISIEKLRMELIKLQERGIVELDILPDKTYVRLIRFDIRFLGERNQYKFIKKKKRRVRKEEKEDKGNDIMYA